ncbi:MAG: DUF2961 domain-containing protein, partial [Bacteroidales bacterium]
MKKTLQLCIMLPGILLFLFSCTSEKITLESLLEEMTDREGLTYFPDPYYTIRQFSSYDRNSIAPDGEGWFANRDYTQFIREETVEGRREYVLFDADGPGAIVRYWMTFAGAGASEGTLRIYIDNNPNPAIEDSVLKILSGGLLAEEPLSTSVSPLTEYQRRGHNLYLPIPYARHCKVTYECDSIVIADETRKPSIYYNINYRTYESGTEVESFSPDVLERSKETVEKTCRTLYEPKASDFQETFSTNNQILNAGDTLKLIFHDPLKAIYEISLQLDAENLNQALRSTVLSIVFDGYNTVWIPVGEFFGTGYQVFPSQTWYTQVTEEGIMKCWWVMPYNESGTLQLINYGTQPVNVAADISINDYTWTKNSMYFGSSWHELNRIHSAQPRSDKDHDWHFDVNYVNIEGEGVYVGDALTVFNTADAWWGEGDEKIFVDGEGFPSCIGTGTEDYYGYAWCRPEIFSHPFIAQPTGAGNFHPGMTVNMRYRTLDAMPFANSIRSDIELWHWAQTKINFAMTSYWYVKPGFSSNADPDPDMVRNPVAMKRTDIYKPVVDENGILEGEWMEILYLDGGIAGVQSGSQFGWSGNSQLWWRNAETGDKLKIRFISQEEGSFSVSGILTQAVDYGIVRFEINGKPAGFTFNGYNSDGVKTVPFSFGMQKIYAGENTIILTITGKDPEAHPGNMAGIDFVK